MYYLVRFFFFFKQKTAYEMRISDWSSECALPISRPAVRYIADIGRLINDLIECDEQEVAEHDFRDWPQTFHRGADRRAEDCSLGDRRVDHTIRTPAFLEAQIGRAHV